MELVQIIKNLLNGGKRYEGFEFMNNASIKQI